MKLAQIEQYDLIGAVRQWFVGRQRAYVVTTIRDHANAMFFASLAEQRRLAERAKRAKTIFEVVFGAEFADFEPWQRDTFYRALKAREAGHELALFAAPLRPF